jgi:hypothetical protein
MVTGTDSPRRTPSGAVDAIATTSRLRRSPKTGAHRVQVRRLAAQEIEGAVIRILVEVLTSPARLLEMFGTGGMPADQIRRMLGRAARLAVAFSCLPRNRAKPVRGLVEKVKAAIATFAITRPKFSFSAPSTRGHMPKLTAATLWSKAAKASPDGTRLLSRFAISTMTDQIALAGNAG